MKEKDKENKFTIRLIEFIKIHDLRLLLFSSLQPEKKLDQEFKNVIDLVLYVFGSLGFEDFTLFIYLDICTIQKKIMIPIIYI